MRKDVQTILKHMGFVDDVDFRTEETVTQGFQLVWISAAQRPTDAAIDAAASAALAAKAAEEADAAQYQTERADLKAQFTAAVTRLEQIRDASTLTNAASLKALNDLAAIQLRVLKYIRRL